MTSRLARDDEITTWRDHGWVVVEGLIGTHEIDAAVKDLEEMFPRASHYQDWIGYAAWQLRAVSPHWTSFVEESTPEELAPFGFPLPATRCGRRCASRRPPSF